MRKTAALLPYAVILTAFFLLLEISLFIQSNRVYLADYTAISHKLIMPASMLPGVIFFLFAQFLLHSLFAVGIWLISMAFTSYFSIKSQHRLPSMICIWFIWIFLILLANQINFPNSHFAHLTKLAVNHHFAEKLFYLMMVFGLFSILPMLMYTIKWLSKNKYYFFLFILLTIGFIFFNFKNASYAFIKSNESRPNIILVGVDSLRPDFLGFFGRETIKTPFLDGFLAQSAVFAEALTPIARTFPAWISILSGEHPKQTGIRTNLSPIELLDKEKLLPVILKKQGYETVYAADEVRFSNIDHKIGFDQIITPPIGVNDFLLGTFNDFPLSNLLINTKAGRVLFPYGHANRAVFFTYQPDSFVARIKDFFSQPRDKPLFLAAHFCLPHYPYLYADLSGDNLSPRQRYQLSVERVDQQLKVFFELLNAEQILDHALVILFSDHGEALEYPGDRITEATQFLPKEKPVPAFYPPSLAEEAVNQSGGHGTDVLGLTQYHSLLAFRAYGEKGFVRKITPGLVSLLDIKPTILDYLNINHKGTRGYSLSLKPLITDKTHQLTKRHFLLESDYSPQSLRTVYPQIQEVVLDSIDLFEVDHLTARLKVKQTMLEKIMNSKQYADYYGDWALAFYPQGDNRYQTILVNLNSGQWTNDLNIDFAKKSPVSIMVDKIKTFYQLKPQIIEQI